MESCLQAFVPFLPLEGYHEPVSTWHETFQIAVVFLGYINIEYLQEWLGFGVDLLFTC